MQNNSKFFVILGVFTAFSVMGHLSAAPPPETPRMYFADDVSGRPFSKDPAVVKFKGTYWLYYSVPPYKDKPTAGWSIGVATSDNLVDWTKAGELRNTGPAEAKGFTAPGAIVLNGTVHLFYQGNNTNGKTWYLSVPPIDWKDGKPIPAPEKLPD